MENIKAPRGVRDILPDESWKWASIFEVTRKIAEDFGYREVHLPIFEQTELFSRGIGETTDVVEKEMYTFSDRSGRSLTLRPEATASMVRAYLEHGMASGPQPSKLWCTGPMMRYERPQKGRYRQFWQLDFEAIGSSSPLVDVEVIALSLEIFRRLGLANLEVLVNSVGCPACRPLYRTALQDYLRMHFDSLCPTCQGRFDRNPLRILDCKVETCKAITDGAPDVRDHLCEECRDHFDEVLKGLDLLGAKFRIDKRLVRGLDYYTKTAYEVLSGDLGAQNAVCGGGRYDNLAEAIGGPHTPGVGFAAGLDRIVLTMEQQRLGFGTEPSDFCHGGGCRGECPRRGLAPPLRTEKGRGSRGYGYFGQGREGPDEGCRNREIEFCLRLGLERDRKGSRSRKGNGHGNPGRSRTRQGCGRPRRQGGICTSLRFFLLKGVLKR